MVALPVEELEKDGHTRDIRSEERGQQRKVNNDRFRLPRFQVRGREEPVWVSLQQFWWKESRKAGSCLG